MCRLGYLIGAVALGTASTFSLTQVMAAQPELPRSLGMKWVEIAPRCYVISDARTGAPIINPYSDDAYSVGAYEDCPKKTTDGGNLVTFEEAAVSDGGARLLAPWGRIYIFPFYSQVEGWGHGQKFRFEWIPPEKF